MSGHKDEIDEKEEIEVNGENYQDADADDILFNLEIQIEDDKTDNIIIRENDDIEEVVDRFCAENNYGENIRKIIMNQIVGALDQNIEDLENEGNEEKVENLPNNHHANHQGDSDEEYDKYMNNQETENVLTTENYNHQPDDRSQSPEFVNYQCTTEYVDENPSEFVVENNSHLENSKFNINRTVNLTDQEMPSEIYKVNTQERSNFINNSDGDNETDSVSRNVNTIITPAHRQSSNESEDNNQTTPRSENSFSHFIEKEKEKVKEKIRMIERERERGRKGESKKNSISNTNNYYTENTSNIPNSNISNNVSNVTNKKYSRFSTTPDKLPGERLYNQYMDKLPKKREHSKRIIEERKKSELKELRTKPSIDRKSERMASNSPLHKTLDKVEDRLIQYGEKKRERITDEMTKKKLIEYDYSYHPNVGEKSQILATIKRKQRMETLSKADNSSYMNRTFDNVMNTQIDSDEELKPVNPVNKNKNSFISSNYKTNNISSENTFKNMRVNINNKENISKNAIRTQDKSNYEGYKTFTSQSEVSIKTPSRSKSKTKKNENNKTIITRSKTPNRERPKTPVKLNPDKSIHDFLYVESKMIKDKKKVEEKEYRKKVYPFKPTIPESSQKLVTRKETKGQFIQRLHNEKKDADELIVNIKKKNDNTQNLFKPTISRGPRDPKTREVTVNLDGYYDKKLLENQIRVKEDAKNSNLEKKKLFMEKTTNIILKMKIERYKQIFDLLDSDGDGFISSRNIRLSALDSDMLKNLTPILENIQKNNLNMSFKEFCITADQYLSVKVFGDNAKTNTNKAKIK